MLLSSLAVQAATSNANIDEPDVKFVALQDVANVDPIVTGSQVTEAQIRSWKKRRELSKSCETCGLNQPYPGDLETE